MARIKPRRAFFANHVLIYLLGGEVGVLSFAMESVLHPPSDQISDDTYLPDLKQKCTLRALL